MERRLKPSELPIEIASGLECEFDHIRCRRECNDIPNPAPELANVLSSMFDYRLSAICLSGGGIRSATFALGLIQALAKRRILSKFDYLSTVSGGGYIGSWLSAWVRTEQVNAFERAAVGVEYEGLSVTGAIDKHFSTDGSEFNSFIFLKYQELKYGLNPELRRKADISKEASLFTFEKDGKLQETIGLFSIDTQIDAASARRDDRPPSAEYAEKRMIATVDERVAKLQAKFEGTQKVREYGIRSVELKLASGLNKQSDSPNPEPGTVKHLRQYSNYMTPSVGIASADSWAFIGLYLRNLFVNWLIFLPLLASVLLIPRFLYALVRESGDLLDNACAAVNRVGMEHPHDRLYLLFASSVLLAAMILVVWSLRFILENVPSKNLRKRVTAGADDKSVILNCVVSLTVAGFAFTTIWWGTGKHYSSLLPPITGSRVEFLSPLYYVLASVGTYGAAYLLFISIRKVRGVPLDTNKASILAAAVASIAGGILLWFCSTSWGSSRDNLALFVVFATPAFILSFLIQATIFVIFSSKRTPDADREWYARLGGWLLISGLGWILVNSLVLYGVGITQWLWTQAELVAKGGADLPASIAVWIVPVATLLTGIGALVGGFSSATSAEGSRLSTGRKKAFQIALQCASVISLLVILITISYVTAVALSKSAGWVRDASSASIVINWIPVFAGQPNHLDYLTQLPTAYFGTWILALTIIGATVACFVNVNVFSLHGAYRDRLVRAYLGASNSYRNADPFTGFSEKDNRQLHRLKSQHPYHVINATLNLIQSSNLAWQDRKAASFIFTPLFCGSWSFGYRRTNEYSLVPNTPGCKSLRYCNKAGKICRKIEECSASKSIRLGTAMAISGAAANPNMGHYSSPLVTFLMGIFNIRLGWWLGNPGKAGSGKDFWQYIAPRKAKRFYERSGPAFAAMPLINEVLGRTSEEKRYVNVTDGGHFENLAIYEMVLRRNRLILVSDAAADSKFKFSEISNAIEKCRVDLGVEIRFRTKLNIPSRNASEEVRRRGQRYAIADIFYPERNSHGQRKRGYLIYLRPTLSGREPIEIQHYAESNPAFPHQSTGDQFFDEVQFEAYRELGLLTMDEVLRADDVKDIVSRFA